MGCMPVGIGSKGDDLYAVIRYTIAENCGCPTVSSTGYPWPYYNPNDWCPDWEIINYCHSPVSYEMTAGPGYPLSNNPPAHTAHCPSTLYYLEKREWLNSESDNTVKTSVGAYHIKPSHWSPRYSKPWWLTDLVIDTNGIFMLQTDRQDYYIFHIDINTNAVISGTNIATQMLAEYWGIYGYKPISMAGNGTTLYILYGAGWDYWPAEFKMGVFDVGTLEFTIIIDIAPTEYDGETLHRLGGDGVNGYIYSTFYIGGEHDTDPEQLILQKRYASVSQRFAVADSLNLTQTYHDTGNWAWNPCSDQDPYGKFRMWCFGGDSTKLIGAGVDCVDGDVGPIFYEFDPDTLAYVRKSNICKTVYANYAQIISFW
jgi:hypothetical protein